jgi:SAM-dependent methyltransferase
LEAPAPSTSIEDVRAYWNSRPCNVRHSDLPLGSKEYFDAVEARKYFVEPHIPEFAGFSDWNGKRVLEIGCGIGTDAVNFARNGADYVGVELSEVSLEIARQRFDVLGLSGQFFAANVEELSASAIPAGPYDLIYSFGVIHHTVDPARALSEVRKFASVDTELRIMLYAKNSYKAILIEAGFDQPEAQDDCPIALTYTPETARALVESAGFSTLSIEQDHIFPYQVNKYVNYEYEKEPWFQAMPPDLFRLLEKRLGWHLLISASIKD